MKRKSVTLHLSLLTAAAVLLCAVAQIQAADKQPNILVIWGDDVGIHNISATTWG